VFNLDRLEPYQLRVSGQRRVRQSARARGRHGRRGFTAARRRQRPRARRSPRRGPSISKVDFRRGKDGAGRVSITTSDSRVQASLKQEGGRWSSISRARRSGRISRAATTSSISRPGSTRST
jgi:type IV pilus assembly protein PilQ